MYRLLLVALVFCGPAGGRAAPRNVPYDEVSNLHLLHPVLSSKPDESFSTIPAEAFTLDTKMTKRNNEHMYTGNISPLTGHHLHHDVEELPDLYLILVKKRDDNDRNNIRDNIRDYIHYRDGHDIRHTVGNDVQYDDRHDDDDDDRTNDDDQSSEYYTPAGRVIRHKPHYHGSTLHRDDRYQTRDDINIPKKQSHSIYLNKHFQPDDFNDKNTRVLPKIFPSKFMMNNKVAKNSEPLIVYVNKDLSSDDSNRVRSVDKPQGGPLPMSVYVDDDRTTDDDDTRTLQELISAMHDPRSPAPIQVRITKEEPQKEQERDSEVEHINRLMHQIRALNRLLHGSDSPEPYTMYINDQVISGEEERTPTAVEHRAPVDGDSGRQASVASEQGAACGARGAAACGDHDTDDDDGEVTTKVPLVSRRKSPRRKGRGSKDYDVPPHDVKPNQWAVFNHDKDPKLKQYVFVAKGEMAFFL